MSTKAKIQAWLPVMKEIEAAGHDPVKLMFSGKISIAACEIIYRAITVCKTKYPEWYLVMGPACEILGV
jgi:hypothetical protein